MIVKYTEYDHYGRKNKETDLQDFLDKHLSDLSMEQKLNGLPKILSNLITKLAERKLIDRDDINDIVGDYSTGVTLPHDWTLEA